MNFSKKIFSGQSITRDDWLTYLKEAHKQSPQMAPLVFEGSKTKGGFNSYEILAQTLKESKSNSLRILDLACGDGHLIYFLEKMVPRLGSVVGVDMSEDELHLAQQKQFKASTEFKCELADQISEPDASFDAVLCHMAFMLMFPIEPVVNEIYRLLRPEGVFAAIISGAPEKDGFFEHFRKLRNELTLERHPNYLLPAISDPRLSSTEFIKEVLPPTKFSKLETKDFIAYSYVELKDLWSHLKDFYLVSALPEVDQTELKRRVEDAAQKFWNPAGKIEVDFSFRLIKCQRCG